eukprot:6240856-Amphidinium_carterae.1
MAKRITRYSILDGISNGTQYRADTLEEVGLEGWNPEGSPAEEWRSLKSYVDSQWATDRLERNWAREQTELAALIVGMVLEVLGQASIGQPEVHLTMYSDSSAARATALRSGTSPRVKHLHIKHLKNSSKSKVTA